MPAPVVARTPEDAVQQALVIALRVRERIPAATAVPYIAVIARHEANRLREEAERHRSLDERPPSDDPASLGDTLPAPLEVDLPELLDLLGALRAAKPDHARDDGARAGLALPGDRRRVRLDPHEDQSLRD